MRRVSCQIFSVTSLLSRSPRHVITFLSLLPDIPLCVGVPGPVPDHAAWPATGRCGRLTSKASDVFTPSERSALHQSLFHCLALSLRRLAVTGSPKVWQSGEPVGERRKRQERDPFVDRIRTAHTKALIRAGAMVARELPRFLHTRCEYCLTTVSIIRFPSYSIR